ncbi:MAG: YbaK/EbsC family protein [Propionibacteriales bacterium]|jgi:Cys-tRNA(Pro)/Cys-tRNA(Cys) deacylase|nr:YbaK/EbsC family protein [Propionibacteriales bacterium]
MTSSHGALDALTAAGVSYRLHEHPPARNFEELHLTGLDINTSAKTLAFTLLDGRVVLAAIPGASRLRYPKLAAALGVSRSALKPADATVLAGLGMLPGGVAPFTTAEVTLVVERSLLELPVVYCGGGRPELSVELSPTAWLQAMPEAIIADLCEETLAQ